MLLTPPFTTQSTSCCAETAHGRVTIAKATMITRTPKAPVLLVNVEIRVPSRWRVSVSEAIECFCVVVQRHVCEFERPGAGDLVVVDHVLQRDRERLARGPRGDPAGFFPA